MRAIPRGPVIIISSTKSHYVPSITAAAKKTGLSAQTIAKKIHSGAPDHLGRYFDLLLTESNVYDDF